MPKKPSDIDQRAELTSSTALTLQQFKKDEERKKAEEKQKNSIETGKTRCKTCFKEISPRRLCSGHGGGGGSEGDPSESSEDKTTQRNDKLPMKTKELVEEFDDWMEAFISMENHEDFDQGSQSEQEAFDPEIIAELIAEGLLIVNAARELKTLSISLQCSPNSLSKEEKKELKKYMKAIINEFNKFKEQHHLLNDCMKITQDAKGNILSISIILPTVALYDAFIQQLSSNLLPEASNKHQSVLSNSEASKKIAMDMEVEAEPEDQNRESFPSPFSIILKPGDFY